MQLLVQDRFSSTRCPQLLHVYHGATTWSRVRVRGLSNAAHFVYLCRYTAFWPRTTGGPPAAFQYLMPDCWQLLTCVADPFSSAVLGCLSTSVTNNQAKQRLIVITRSAGDTLFEVSKYCSQVLSNRQKASTSADACDSVRNIKLYVLIASLWLAGCCSKVYGVREPSIKALLKPVQCAYEAVHATLQ